ncbi:DUF6090 family protein [Balneola sp. MJW-20]|uniref:DUF6090 family protein n=1 Tax=Gracilimonas aurantiaca TaxID=3234185 RepID=UPI0034651038
MITIFRRIRQKLIDSGSVTKYMLYAIGEILLVVVGILIALQVNNWNLDRLDRQREKEVLGDLKVEFEANLYDLNRVLKQHEVIYHELQEVQKITLSRNYKDNRLDSLMFGFAKWFGFTDRPGASTNLVNSGSLNLISNDELRDLITQWSGTVNDVVDDEIYAADYIRETVLPFLGKYYPLSNIEIANKNYVETIGQSLGPDFDPVFPLQEVDWEILFDNEEFQSILSMRLLNEYHNMLEGRLALRSNKRILELIRQELES